MRLLKFAIVASIAAPFATSLSFAQEATKPPATVHPAAKDAAAQPTFDGDQAVVQLPAAMDDVVLGGGGRFVIGRLHGQRKLVIVDTFTATLAKTIELPPGGIALAAGREKLMIGEKESGVVSRWNLKTFEKEGATVTPVEGPIKAMAMGCDALGPLIVCGERKSAILNPASMKFETFSWAPPGDFVHPNSVAASADGHGIVGDNDPTGRPAVLMIVGLEKIIVRRQNQNIPATGTLVPAAEGRGLFESGVTPPKLWRADLAKASPLDVAFANVCPSTDAAFFTSWASAKDEKPKAGIFSFGDHRPLITLDAFAELGTPSQLPGYERLQFIAKSNLLISVGDGDSKVFLRKFDLLKALDEKGTDYLFLTSVPPTNAVKGKIISYAVTVKSKRGGVTFSLDAGPKGMTISPAGVVKWSAPPVMAEKEVSVTVKITDASGQTLYQDFALDIVDAPPPPAKPTQTASGNSKGPKADNRGFMDRALGPIDKIRQKE